MPGMPTTRVAGPQTGDNTCANFSPLTPTLPVASMTGLKLADCTLTRWMRWRCSAVRLKFAGLGAEEVSGPCFAVLSPHAAARINVKPEKYRMVVAFIGLLRHSGRGPARDRD